jgi:co-chaperonin GroES (HSP10)
VSTESKYQVDGRSESDCFPELDPGVQPQGNRIVVQLRKAKDVSKGGIILVGDTKATEKWNEVIAKVVKVGPLAYKDVSTLEPWPEGPWANPGELVRVIKYGGDRWAVPHGNGEVVFIILQDREVICKIDSFETARTMFPAFVE